VSAGSRFVTFPSRPFSGGLFPYSLVGGLAQVRSGKACVQSWGQTVKSPFDLLACSARELAHASGLWSWQCGEAARARGLADLTGSQEGLE
jgi:hypothetical protein